MGDTVPVGTSIKTRVGVVDIEVHSLSAAAAVAEFAKALEAVTVQEDALKARDRGRG